jgi:hypothetical protein
VHISLKDYPPTSKFTFTADTNHFIDARLVSSTKNSYKAKSQKYTTMECGLLSRKTATLGGAFSQQKRYSTTGFCPVLLYLV